MICIHVYYSVSVLRWNEEMRRSRFYSYTNQHNWSYTWCKHNYGWNYYSFQNHACTQGIWIKSLDADIVMSVALLFSFHCSNTKCLFIIFKMWDPCFGGSFARSPCMSPARRIYLFETSKYWKSASTANDRKTAAATKGQIETKWK